MADCLKSPKWTIRTFLSFWTTSTETTLYTTGNAPKYKEQTFTSIMNYKKTQYGFEYGAATIDRKCSDDKKGWVCLGIETPRATLSVYVTKTGKVRIHDQKTGQELLPANTEVTRKGAQSRS